MTNTGVAAFRRTVWAHYQKQGRHDLPWRKTRDAYAILVSEVMLQQTQVDRVIPIYGRFLARFPTVSSLAEAPLRDVLMAWQGLGYNRRAKMLREAARVVCARYGGAVPCEAKELEMLPGVGAYTANAVAAFAGNVDGVCIETNIRTAVIYHFFSRSGGAPARAKVADRDIERILKKALPKGRAREWYAALMDYGTHLKREGARLNGRHAGYAKQKAFTGSAREARGAILRALASAIGATSGIAQKELTGLLGRERRAQVRAALARLAAEGLVEKRGGVWTLPRS